MKWKQLTAALLFAGLAGWTPLPAAAQAIYRCGNSYSQQPCSGGKIVHADDARSASQKSQTDQAVRRDAQAAEALEKARLKDEAIPAQVLLPPAKPQGAPLKPMVTPTLKKPDQFTAVAPKKPGEAVKKKKKKAKNKDA